MSTTRPALVLLFLFTLLTGAIYPAVVTVAAQLLFPSQANGSLIHAGKAVRGSRLIGQSFTDPGHFWSRPSATAPVPYNGAASGGSNQGPLNPALAQGGRARVEALRALEPDNAAPVPVDLVTASASGLDPHISPAAARYQVRRVAAMRGLDVAMVGKLVEQHTEERAWGLLGEPRVNVLELNLALDRLNSRHTLQR
jgi:K+-transporting ATPase ATPase C chain